MSKKPLPHPLQFPEWTGHGIVWLEIFGVLIANDEEIPEQELYRSSVNMIIRFDTKKPMINVPCKTVRI